MLVQGRTDATIPALIYSERFSWPPSLGLYFVIRALNSDVAALFARQHFHATRLSSTNLLLKKGLSYLANRRLT